MLRSRGLEEVATAWRSTRIFHHDQTVAPAVGQDSSRYADALSVIAERLMKRRQFTDSTIDLVSFALVWVV